MENKILNIIQNVLGPGKHTTKDNYIFHCPKCNHRKPKLEVGMLSGKWHCWVCKHGGLSLFTLLKWVDAPSSQRSALSSLLQTKPRRFVDNNEHYNPGPIGLPDEFLPLWKIQANNFFQAKALSYLASRDISSAEILKYRIGYCYEGPFAHMVIIPSFDRFGALNYFFGRSYMDKPEVKFKNPMISKDIIGFDFMINWAEPIILVESAFDAIAIRRNAIPLFGKAIPQAVKQKIIEQSVKRVYICLDGDAIIDGIDYIEFFIGNGIEVYLVMIPDGQDPSSLGYHQVWRYIHNSKLVDSGLLMKLKVSEHLYGEGKTNISHRRYTRSSFTKAHGVPRNIKAFFKKG